MIKNYSNNGRVSNRHPRGAYQRKVRSVGNQPLKPVTITWRFWTLLTIIGVLLGVVSLKNKETISWYLNRPIDTVRIETTLQHVTEDEVKTLLAVYIGEGFFNVDVSSIRSRLETHPWIARVEVKRVWPNILVLGVTEEIAIARWGQTGLLNQYAKVFKPDQLEPMRSLPLLSGPDGSQTIVMEQYQVLNQLLFPVGLRLEQLTLSNRNSWEIGVNEGMKIVVGKTDVRERVKRFIDIYDSQIRNDIAVIERIDLRYSNGFSVKKKQHDISGVAIR